MVAARNSADFAALKERHPLGDVVEAAGIRLRGRGGVRQGVCPFHEEAEGSFTVYADSQKWYCFGCGERGDVLDFLRRTEGLSLPEAIRRLDASPPAAVPVRRTTRERRHRDAVAPLDPALLTAAARHYAGELRRSPEARAYLASRGVGPGTARRLGLGYAPGHGLRAALAAAGVDGERFPASGLFTGRGERFAGMLVVPEIAGGRVRWLAGRAIDPERSPRFQALPGPKPVLGLGRLGPAPPWAVVAEGVFDWLVLGEWGLPACAALGTQGMERVAAALRGCPRVFLAFDQDDAGREATAALGGLLGRRAAAVELPEGVADVAELATHPGGRGTFLCLLERAARAAR
jgi:DNA primase